MHLPVSRFHSISLRSAATEEAGRSGGRSRRAPRPCGRASSLGTPSPTCARCSEPSSAAEIRWLSPQKARQLTAAPPPCCISLRGSGAATGCTRRSCCPCRRSRGARRRTPPRHAARVVDHREDRLRAARCAASSAARGGSGGIAKPTRRPSCRRRRGRASRTTWSSAVKGGAAAPNSAEAIIRGSGAATPTRSNLAHSFSSNSNHAIKLGEPERPWSGAPARPLVRRPRVDAGDEQLSSSTPWR